MPSNAFLQLQTTLAQIVAAQVAMDAALQTSSTECGEIAIEGCFVRAIVAFEKFLEDYFLDLVTERYKPKSHVIRLRAKFASHADAQDFILLDKKYADWLPYKTTTKRAERFIMDGLPFTKLPDVEKGSISDAMTVRHRIAHSSESSRKEFSQRFFPTIAQNVPGPAALLRTPLSHGSKLMKFNGFMSTFINAALHLDPP